MYRTYVLVGVIFNPHALTFFKNERCKGTYVHTYVHMFCRFVYWILFGFFSKVTSWNDFFEFERYAVRTYGTI